MFRTLPMSPIASSLRSFVRGLAPDAWYQFGTGITVVGAGVDTWADQSGNARDLLQATDTNRPTLNADGSITFDGADNYLKASAFTLNQPETVYLLVNPVTWADNATLFDGNGADTGALYQTTATPRVDLYAGATAAANTNLVLGAYAAVAGIFNGASSVMQVNNTTPTTGNAGAANMGGFTLGAGAAPANYANIQVKEVIIFAAAHDASTRARVIRYLMQVGQVA